MKNKRPPRPSVLLQPLQVRQEASNTSMPDVPSSESQFVSTDGTIETVRENEEVVMTNSMPPKFIVQPISNLEEVEDSSNSLPDPCQFEYSSDVTQSEENKENSMSCSVFPYLSLIFFSPGECTPAGLPKVQKSADGNFCFFNNIYLEHLCNKFYYY